MATNRWLFINKVMNWKQISEEYFKSFEKLNEWYGKGLLRFHETENRYGHYFNDGFHHVLIWNDFELRDLYDFFDYNGLHININYKEYNDGTGMYGDNNEYPTRREAEEAAFMRAFKILNEK